MLELPHVGDVPFQPVPSDWHSNVELPSSVKPTSQEKTTVPPSIDIVNIPLSGSVGWSQPMKDIYVAGPQS